MENSEIMKRLMQDGNNPISQQKSTPASNGVKRDGDLSLSKIRVVTAKYKVLMVLCLIFICIMWFNFIPDAQRSYDSSLSAYNTDNLKLSSISAKIVESNNDIKFLSGIIYNEQNLAKCLNKNSENSSICSNLPEEWKIGSGDTLEDYDTRIPLSYLQLHSLYNKKLAVDEKKVLKNLNNYLIKEKIEGTGKNTVGTILRISIGEPNFVTPGDEHFFVVPVDVEIEFTQIEDLIGFLYNVEKKIIDKENGEDRILYKIQTVSYDIISSDEPQTTDISMLAYYYYDDRFLEEDEISGKLKEMDEYEYYFGDKYKNKTLENTENVKDSSDDKGNMMDKIKSWIN